MLFIEDIQHFFQCHAVAGLYQNGIAGLHPVQQSIGGLAVIFRVQGLYPLGSSHHGSALGLLAVGDQAVQPALGGKASQLDRKSVV